MSAVWGATATVCLASATTAWLTSGTAGPPGVFGPTGSVGLMALATVVIRDGDGDSVQLAHRVAPHRKPH